MTKMSTSKRLDLHDRKAIQDGLAKGISFAQIGRVINRATSTIASEVKLNRMLMKKQVVSVKCKDQETCKATGICEECKTPGVHCARCKTVHCKEVCTKHLSHTGCAKTTRAPWVCNGCKYRNYNCKRAGRYVYDAIVADRMARERRSTSRRGINMTAVKFESALGIIRPALARNLSPYEIATLYAGSLGVSESTLYRWVDQGYGGLANIDLERKVGFKPRKQREEQKVTHHGRHRSYNAFLALTQDEQDGCCEMDTVLGKKTDTKCLLTLYIRPAHFQFYILLENKTLSSVKKALDGLEEVAGRQLFLELFSVILTDNGGEFADPVLLETSTIPVLGKRSSIYYCDPRRSDQKARCEKGHSELRQKIPKGASLENLDVWDLAKISEQINSTPKRSLCGMSPIEMLYKAYGEKVGVLLDYLGIAQLGADDIDLRPHEQKGYKQTADELLF
jgi:IS30 family transposase